VIFQVIFVAFTIACISTSIWALVTIWRSEKLRWKPLWTIGSLFGFLGLGINWHAADDLVIHIGVQVPVLYLAQLPSGFLIAKSSFPMVALVAIGLARRHQVNSLAEIFDENRDKSGL
jgi:hypothetical protein